MSVLNSKSLKSPSITSIPAKWAAAASFLAELRNRKPLNIDEWDVIIDWLSSSKFDHRSYLAGEVAAGLVRDLAPNTVKARFRGVRSTDKWQQHFQTIVTSGKSRKKELAADKSNQEKIIVDGNVRVTIVRIGPDTVKIGIEAPPGTQIVRKNVSAQKKDRK